MVYIYAKKNRCVIIRETVMSHDRWMGVALVAENINNQTETLGCCLR